MRATHISLTFASGVHRPNGQIGGVGQSKAPVAITSLQASPNDDLTFETEHASCPTSTQWSQRILA